MKKGAVPIPYIIALLLGIAVVAILGYWFFVLGGEWGGEMNLQRCRSNAITYCTSWQALGYSKDENTGEPSLGWFEAVYERCTGQASTLGFSGSDGDDEEIACVAILSGS